MNPTANNNILKKPTEKLKPVEKEVRKKSKLENETLTLVDIAKAIEEVKTDGFGRVVIFVQNGRIFRWEQVKSRTKRRAKRYLTSFNY